MANEKPRLATTSLAGCFGCHMSFLDIDEALIAVADIVEFDRSPITDIKHVTDCDIGLIEGGICNAENIEVLKEFREQCKILVAVGACAITGGVPALRNHFELKDCLEEVYIVASSRAHRAWQPARKSRLYLAISSEIWPLEIFKLIVVDGHL